MSYEVGGKTALAVIEYGFSEHKRYIKLKGIKRYLRDRSDFERLPSDSSINAVLNMLEREGWLYREGDRAKKWYVDISKISDLGRSIASREIDKAIKDMKELRSEIDET